MTKHKIVPEKVTRPFQLLAAWLTGLIIVDGAFLTAATQLQSPVWVSGALVVAAIVNVPLFLISIFLLQTKFRPEMQEDVYYSKYLEYQRTDKTTPTKIENIETQIKKITQSILEQIGPIKEESREPIEQILHDSQVGLIANRVGGTRILSELYLRPRHWSVLIDLWEGDNIFHVDLDLLLQDGIVTMKGEDLLSCRLTKLGIQIAEYAESKGLLFAQQKGRKHSWEEEGRLNIRSKRRIKKRA